jgi:ankyrin repeat protein
LLAWLEKNRRRWRDDRSLSIDIERAAVEENNWPACVLLMEMGFEPTSLFEEAMSYSRFDLARSLVQTGRVEREAVAECLTGAPPVLWHLPPLLEELVAAGADVNHEAENGDTPLHDAVAARSEAGVRFLLDRGADPTVQNDDRRTPLALARRLEETKLAALLQEGERAWAARPRPAEPDVQEFDLCGVEITEPGPALTLDDVRAAERDFGLEFPPEYRWLLLRANGGKPRPGVLPIEGDEEDEGYEEDAEDYSDDYDEDYDELEDFDDVEPIVELLPLRKGQAQGEVVVDDTGERFEGDTVESAREWYHDGSSIPRGMIPIGSLDEYGCEGAGYLLLGCKGRNRGQLFAFDHGERPLGLTLPGLFAALRQAGDRPKDAGQRLADAVEARDLAAVRAALAEGARAEHTTRDGRAPLALAAKAGFDEALQAMVEAGAGVEQAFTAAVEEERFDFALGLLARKPAPSKRYLAEQLAISPNLMKRMDLVRAILARGVKVKNKLEGGHTYLHNAAASGSEEAINFFLAKGVDVNAKNAEGDTPLHYAGADGAAAAVRVLLARGAKVGQPNSEGETALHGAMRFGNVEVARLLLDAGEDLHARFDLRPPGMSAERAQREARRVAEMLEGGLDDLLGLDDDGPEPPDTSEPTGEKVAGLMEAMGQAMGRMSSQMAGMQDRLAAMARGEWGKGRSAAEVAGDTEEGRRALAQLEAERKGGVSEPPG